MSWETYRMIIIFISYWIGLYVGYKWGKGDRK